MIFHSVFSNDYNFGFTLFVPENPECVRVLVAEKLSGDDVMVAPDKLQVSAVVLFLQPVLSPVDCRLASRPELSGSLVLARWAVPKDQHLKVTKTE